MVVVKGLKEEVAGDLLSCVCGAEAGLLNKSE